MTFIEENNDQMFTVRLTKADLGALDEIAKKLGGRGTRSKLVRYAIRKHVVEAREKFSENPDFWK